VAGLEVDVALAPVAVLGLGSREHAGDHEDGRCVAHRGLVQAGALERRSPIPCRLHLGSMYPWQVVEDAVRPWPRRPPGDRARLPKERCDSPGCWSHPARPRAAARPRPGSGADSRTSAPNDAWREWTRATPHPRVSARAAEPCRRRRVDMPPTRRPLTRAWAGLRWASDGVGGGRSDRARRARMDVAGEAAGADGGPPPPQPVITAASQQSEGGSGDHSPIVGRGSERHHRWSLPVVGLGQGAGRPDSSAPSDRRLPGRPNPRWSRPSAGWRPRCAELGGPPGHRGPVRLAHPPGHGAARPLAGPAGRP